ncbi:MAG: RimK family protein [Spirochaetes bacterium]|nr:RimK family protein [Spirochaetota bacterium]
MADINGKSTPAAGAEKYIVIVENKNDWDVSYPSLNIITVKDYLSDPLYTKLKDAKIINLSRSYRYLSRGYFCSFLAEARKQRIIPSVRTLRDLSKKAIYQIDTDVDELDDIIEKCFLKLWGKHSQHDSIEIYVFFGLCDNPYFEKFAEEIFDTFRCPVLKIEFEKEKDGWEISTIKALTLNAIPEDRKELFSASIAKYTKRRWVRPRGKNILRYDLAILYNPEEKLPPSNKKALNKFISIGKKLNIDVELITKKDYSRLAEYDALFIRETTALEHYTYMFSKKAESEGLIVIDDPDSILRCTNKVYLAELLNANKIPAPKSMIFIKDSNVENLECTIPYPVVLKIPDGSFSLGVYKAGNREELVKISELLFRESDIILAQEFLYTEFDWRIGILNRTPLYASQYFMSGKHWQIYNHAVKSGANYGRTRTIPVEEAPEPVVTAALNAANLIGNGLYGVDLKQTDNGVVVIEVNDNPSIEAGDEDAYLKDELYRKILMHFIEKIEKRA